MVVEKNKEPVDHHDSKKPKNSDRSRSSSSSDYNNKKPKKRHNRSRSSSIDSCGYSGSRHRHHRRDYRSRSRSGNRYNRDRYSPRKSRVLGVFGLSSNTINYDLEVEFGRYGPISDVKIVYDVKTGNSRGFGFIYFDYQKDATAARRACNGMMLHGRRIRVDYSITKRAHSPTPGRYMGSRGKSSYRNENSSYYSSSTSHYRRRLSYQRSP